jgi:conjugal transfer/entry exclusion protein
MVAARTFGSSGNKSIDHKTFRSRKISLGLATGLLPLDLSIAGITTSTSITLIDQINYASNSLTATNIYLIMKINDIET